MSLANLSSVHTILEEYDIDQLANVPDRFKCVKCQNIHKNPFHVLCGCQYCFQCIKDMTANEVETCFGHLPDCNDSNPSSHVPNYQLNKEISKLEMKCPIERWLHNSVLFLVPEHVRVCEMQKINCPLRNYGCMLQRLSKTDMVDHFLNEQYSHHKIILDLIGVLSNKVTDLEQSERVQKNELTVLKQEVIEKEEKLELLVEQVKSFQKEKEELVQKLEAIKNDWDEKVGIQKKEGKRNTFSIVPQIVKHVIVEGHQPFYWTVEEMSEKLKNCQQLNSGYFYNRMYKMQLVFYKFARLYFNLCVHPGDNDHNLKWPFKAKVSLTVGADIKKGITVTKHCVIQRPVNNVRQFSESFNFNYVDCCNEGLFSSDTFTVQCKLSIP